MALVLDSVDAVVVVSTSVIGSVGRASSPVTGAAGVVGGGPGTPAPVVREIPFTASHSPRLNCG